MAAPIHHANTAKTHCKRGHEFTQDNTRIYKGARFCLECDRMRRSSPEYKEQKANRDKAYYTANREAIAKSSKARNAEYYRNHKDEYLERSRRYYRDNPGKFREIAIAYRKSHPELIAAYNRSDKKKEAQRRYLLSHAEQVEEKNRLYRQSDRRREYIRIWTSDRYRHDPLFNLVTKVRRRIHMALRGAFHGTRKADGTINLIGCSYDELKRHIEKQFTPGMTWEKCFSGEIHLDHIRPCASFDLTDNAQQMECFHYTNLQPLWAQENLRKHAKYQEIYEPSSTD